LSKLWFGKNKLFHVAVVTPLNNFLGPEGDTVTADNHYCPKKKRVTKVHSKTLPDNGFKSVCQMKWVNSITQPHSNVNRTHPHPHHTPLVNGLQHLCARN